MMSVKKKKNKKKRVIYKKEVIHFNEPERPRGTNKSRVQFGFLFPYSSYYIICNNKKTMVLKRESISSSSDRRLSFPICLSVYRLLVSFFSCKCAMRNPSVR